MKSETEELTKPRQEHTAHFTAENIDNTAPVDKILEEFQHRNPKAYRFYGQNIKQRYATNNNHMNYHYILPGHPLNAFAKDWDGELNLEYFEPFPYKSHAPKMISTLKNINEKDPVTAFMMDKMQWHEESVKVRGKYKRTNYTYECLNDEVVQCSKHMVNVAAHLDSDPDPYFDCSYNWYYAGNGNLQLVCIDWVDYLLHSELTTVHLSEFSKNDLHINPNPVAHFDCGNKNNILETICSPQNIIVLRTKYKIFILNLIKSNDVITIEKLKCIQSEMPYTSISFDDFHKNILYITTLDFKLSIVNLDRMKARSVKLKGNVATLVNNWNAVTGTGRGFYTHVGGNTVSVYDKRSNSAIHEWRGLRGITDYLSCNDISVVKHCEDSTSLYFGTDHHLLLMDLRSLPSRVPKVIQRWTHGMECVPTYMNRCNFVFNKDLICLSSQWCKDMCLVPNYNDNLIVDTESRGVTIPYRPPNILDTLHEARQRGLCHDLYNPLDSRICTSITGNLILEQDEKYDILVQNALGDISCHRLFPDYMELFNEDNSAQNLSDWSQPYVREKKAHEVTAVLNIDRLWKRLKKVPRDLKILGDDEEVSKFNEQEIIDAFENEEIEIGLEEVWKQGETIASDNANESSALQLHYSDDDKENE